MEHLKRLAPQLLALMAVMFFVISLLVSLQESTVMDEKAHIPAGYSYVKYQDMRINPEHPPLLKDLAGLALLFLNPAPVMPKTDPLWESGDWLDSSKFMNGPERTWGLAQWSFGDKILHENGNNEDDITVWARFPIILVALLLGFFIFRWTRELSGTVAGLFAAMLYFFDPNIIGHSHYVTTDIGIATFIFIAFYYFVRFLKTPTWKNIILAGIFLGVAELTKFSAVLLFPIFGLFVLLYGLTTPIETMPGAWKVRLKNVFTYLLKYAGSVAIAFVVIWVLYAINTWNMPGNVIAEIARAQFPNDKLVGRVAENTVVFMSGHALFKPLAEYFLGVFMVFARVAGGNTYYFLGAVSNQASRWYFPIVFLLKETLPLLFLLVATLGYTLIRGSRQLMQITLSGWWGLITNIFRERVTQALMVFFVLFYAYVSITGNLNIGFRHLFPILPFLYVLIAKVVFDILKRIREEIFTSNILQLVVGVISLIVITIPILSYPSYLSYFNPIGGGHLGGYRYVTDSNYDWGQDLRRLNEFVETHNLCLQNPGTLPGCNDFLTTLPTINKIRVDYFGGASPEYYLRDKYTAWHSNLPPESGWYAISIGFLQEDLHKTRPVGEQAGYEWLRNTAPVARVGDSLFVYYRP